MAAAASRRRHVLPVKISPTVLEDETHNKQQQPQPSVTRTGHSEALLGQSVARFDAKPLAVVVSGIAWSVDERRVSGVAVTRHSIFVVPSSLVDTVNEHRERYLPGESVLNLTTPAAVKLILNRFAPLDDRNDVGVVVGVQQIETSAVVEASVEIDGLDAEVKAIKQFKELTEYITGGFASG